MCLKAGWAALKSKIERQFNIFMCEISMATLFWIFFETLCDKMKNIGLFVVRGRRVCNRPSTFNNVHLVSITWQSDIIVLNEPWMLCYIHWLIVLYAQSAFKVARSWKQAAKAYSQDDLPFMLILFSLTVYGGIFKKTDIYIFQSWAFFRFFCNRNFK